MRAAEILRHLADIVDAAQKGSNTATLTKVDSELPGETEPTPQSTDSMIPPLQQKLELLKKASGVPSVFDDNCEEPDELDHIKKVAGIQINPTALHIAGEDNDVLG